MVQVLRTPFPIGYLYQQYFVGSYVEPELSVTEMHPHSSNPIITNATVESAGMGHPKEPDCIKVGSTYYMVVTLWSTYAVPSIANRRLALIKSTNLVDWTYVKTLLVGAHAAALFQWNGAFHILYSFHPAAADAFGWMHTADLSNIEGDWTDVGAILSDGARDPFVFVESGTVYIFSVATGAGVSYCTTTQTDFTSLSAQTNVLPLPSTVYSFEAPYVVKVGTTYYMFLAEYPVNSPTDNPYWASSTAVYTSEAITGPWTKLTNSCIRGIFTTWHYQQHGHISFVRSGDIEDNPGPLQVGDNYPMFNEGGNGTLWQTGLFYGKKKAERTAFTQVRAGTHPVSSIDVAASRLWMEDFLSTMICTLGYTLAGGGTLWDVTAVLTIGDGAAAVGAGVGIVGWGDSNNWWTARLDPAGKLWIGRLTANSWSWTHTYTGLTLAKQTDHTLRIQKTASDTFKYFVNGAEIGSITEASFPDARTLALSADHCNATAKSVVVSAG